MRLIDVDALIDSLGVGDEELYCKHTIEEQPTIEAVPVVHGEWVKNDNGCRVCSVCDSEAYWDTDYGQQLFDWCPYCGADMRK